MKKTSLSVILLASLASFAGCGSSSDDSTTEAAAPTESTSSSPSPATPVAAEGTAVNIEGFAYDPDPITVEKGATVTFTNNDDAPHTATADDKSFDTGSFNKGESKDVTFDTAGTIPYICTIHPFMHGEIVVQ